MPDQFAQRFVIDVTESAANTLTFQQLVTGGSLFEKRALIIHRVEYQWVPTTLNLLLDGSDFVTAALTVSQNLSDLSIADPMIFDRTRWGVFDIGTPASSQIYDPTQIHDFSTLPGGGIIIPAFPIYAAVVGTSLASAASAHLNVWYTTKDLKPDEYIELVEAFRVFT